MIDMRFLKYSSLDRLISCKSAHRKSLFFFCCPLPCNSPPYRDSENWALGGGLEENKRCIDDPPTPYTTNQERKRHQGHQLTPLSQPNGIDGILIFIFMVYIIMMSAQASEAQLGNEILISPLPMFTCLPQFCACPALELKKGPPTCFHPLQKWPRKSWSVPREREEEKLVPL